MKKVFKILYLFGIGWIMASVSTTLLIIATIFTEGIIKFAEPNLIILTLELIWSMIGIITIPAIIKYTLRDS